MIKYDNNGEIIACLLDETGVISKERIKQENYKQYKKDFDEVVELLSLNKLYHSMCSELLNYEITDDLEFKTIVIDKYDTPPDTDENISYKLKYDSKKYYQFKESVFIKLGIQLKVSEARKSKFFLFPEEAQNGDNVYLDFE